MSLLVLYKDLVICHVYGLYFYGAIGSAVEYSVTRTSLSGKVGVWRPSASRSVFTRRR